MEDEKNLKKYYKKRRYKKKSTRQLALTALKMVRKEVQSPELKYHTTIATSQVVPDNGVIVNLSLVSQGVTDSTRVGDSLTMIKSKWNAQLNRGSQDTVVRVILFIDNDNTIASPTDFWQTVGFATSALGQKRHDKRFNSKVLYDRLFNLDIYNPQSIVNWDIKINKNTQYQGGSTTVESNCLKVFLISQIPITFGEPLITYSHRLLFKDS